MAIYQLSVKLITRSTGRSATAAAAYRAGEKIHANRTGQTFDCLHNKVGNPHAHILLTTREINLTNNGFGKKNREWNDKENLKIWRQEWEKHCNRRLSIAGSKSRIDHRSLKNQGLDRIYEFDFEGTT